MAVIKTKTCVVCGNAGEVEVTEAELEAYNTQPEQIQKVLPRLTPGEREMLISGTHSECFDVLFPPEDEDEEWD
jgi:hypothetical protein